jgi:hypothetical protein
LLIGTIVTAVSTLDDDIETLTDVVDGDWGPNNVFWALKGETYEETFGEYTCVQHIYITLYHIHNVISHALLHRSLLV